MIQQTLTFLKTRRTALLFTGLVFAVCLYGTAMDLVDVDGDLIVFTLGLAVLLVTPLDRPNRSRGDYTFLVLREFDRDVDGIVFPD